MKIPPSALAGVLLLLGACDQNEPLAPIGTAETEVFRPYGDPQVWAEASVDVRRTVWERYVEEFATFRSARDYPRLLRLAQEGRHFFPDERAAWVNLSTALMIHGLDGRCISAAVGALDPGRLTVFDADESNRLRPQAHCNLAVARIALGDLAAALEEADAALAINADFARAHFIRGEVLHRLGRSEEAVASHRSGLALNPEPPDIVSSDIVILSNALRDLGRVDEAEAALRQGIEMMPFDFGLHFHLGLLLHRVGGRAWEAHAELQHELVLRPDTPYRDRALTTIGEIEWQAESEAGGRANPLAVLARARVLSRDGRSAEAFALRESIVEEASDDSPSLHLRLLIARGHRDLGQLEEAEQWYHRALERDPMFVPGWVELALVQEARDDHDSALRSLATARARDPLSWRLMALFQEDPGWVEELADYDMEGR